MSNITRTSLDALSQANFPNNTSQQISPADLRDWIESAVDSFVTQKDKSTFENAFYECKSSDITVSGIGSCNLVLATGNFVHIKSSGPATINSFGSLPAGSRFILNFEVAVTLQYNATSLIIPGAADIITAAGDSIMIVSEGSGNWRLIGYFPAAGLPVGTVTAVTASAPLSSTGGNAPDISISQAGASTDGYLSSADWNTFDGKQDALTLTTSGTSGAATLIGSTLNIPNYTTGGGGGTPGGADTEVQYNNAGAFGGIPELTYSGGFVQIETPKIGVGSGNGHLHIHSANSAPTGITDYLTMFWQKATRVLGFRSETDTHETYLQFTAPTADRTYTFPDASGNVVLDTNSQTLSNKTLSTPTIDGIATFGNGTSAGEIRLLEPSGSGTEYVAIKSQAIPTGSSYSLTLPGSTPGSGQTLVSDGSGVLSWSSNPGTTNAQYLRAYGGTTTGSTAEQILQSLLIPANTYKDGTGFMIRAMFTRGSPTGNAITAKIYINTSIAAAGANLTSTGYTIPANTGGFFQMDRLCFIQLATGASRSTIYLTNNSNSNTATGGTYPGSGTALSSFAIDWSVDQYVILTLAAGNTAATNTCNALMIMPQ